MGHPYVRDGGTTFQHDVLPALQAVVRERDEARAQAAAYGAKVAEELAAMTGVRSELVDVLRELMEWVHSNGGTPSAVFHARDLLERLQLGAK
jgi:hypothetical protein